MRFKPFDWYATPLYYDIIFDADTTREADFLQAVMQRHVTCMKTQHATILEPACGTGRLLEVLRRRGHTCVGFDLSDGMLSLARERCPEVLTFKGMMQDFTLPRGAAKRYDFAFNLVSTFKHVDNEADARMHLKRMADVLKPGGVYALGVHESQYDETRKQRERWVAEREGVHVVCNIQSWPAEETTRTEPMRSRLVVTQNGETSAYESTWTFRTYDQDELRDLIQSEPRFEHVTTYGFDCNIDKPHDFDDGDRLDHIFVLRRVEERAFDRINGMKRIGQD